MMVLGHYVEATLMLQDDQRFITRCGLVACSLTLGLALCEVSLRLGHYEYVPLKIETTNPNDRRSYHMFQDRYLSYDPYLIWAPRRNFSVFNSQGYRGEELPRHKAPGSFRIFAIGDSNTLGWFGANDGPNWPAYLQQQFRSRGRQVTVTNAGVPGYSSFQGLRRFQEALVFQPDVVLISFGSNDAHPVRLSDAQFIRLNLVRTTSMARVLRASRLGQLIVSLPDALVMQHGHGALVPRVSLQAYQNHLREIILPLKKRRITVVLLTRPFIGASRDPARWKTAAPQYNAATQAVAEETHTPWIDVYRYFQGAASNFEDESHFNTRGHQLMAELIYEHIKDLVN